MGQNSSKKNKFVIQGSILALAGILVRVIGLVYRVPLTRILGREGLGYYNTAYDIYNILILLSSQSMPLAVSKIVSEKLSRRQYKNAYKALKGALIYAVILGGAIGLFAFIGSDWIAGVIFKSPLAGRAFRVLAPTLTVACILGVLRGFFQGMGNMLPTAISQIFEQIINAMVSVIAAYELGAYGYAIAKTAEEKNILHDSYAAMGGTLGTLAGAIAAFFVVAAIFLYNKNRITRRVIRDNASEIDSYSKIMKLIVYTITPVLISTTIYNIGNLLDNILYQNIMNNFFNITESIRQANYGIYSGYYRLLTTMPIAIASSLSTAIVPSLVRSYVAGDKQIVTNKISLALKFSMIVAFPCGMGLSVLGEPINLMLFGSKASDTALMMAFSIFGVVAYSLSTISNAILQGIDKLKVPIKNSTISLVIHLILLPILLIVFKWDIYAVIIGDFLFATTMSILNAFSIKKYLGYRQNLKDTFINPLICSVVMGIGCYVIYFIFMKLIHINIISTLFAIIIAVILYAVMLIITKTITEEELYSMPKGLTIAGILKKVHLLK